MSVFSLVTHEPNSDQFVQAYTFKLRLEDLVQSKTGVFYLFNYFIQL